MTFKVKQSKKPKGKSFAVETKKKDKKQLFLQDIKKRGTITEKEILLVKRRLNDGTYTQDDVSEFYDLKITPEQTQKGLKWLKNKWKSPRGVERKNNPFGYREEDVIDNFKEFRLNSFTNSGNQFVDNWIPVYDVKAKDGSGFQYIVQGGEVNITA